MRISTLALVLFTCVAPISAAEHAGSDPDEALARLERGNARASSGTLMHPHQSAARRTAVAREQHPFAVVVSCSDSRVPPELIFDQGIGDLFVVRTAGEVLDSPGLGSIEYAVDHLGARLVVVLGHERCGAVEAAVNGGDVPANVASLVEAIRPAVDEARKSEGDTLDLAVRANVRRVVRQVSGDVKVRVVGMVYDLDTGKVEVLP
jgi:carbonic anhydrase